MKNGMMVNINSKLDFDTASIVAEAFEINLQRDNSQGVKVEDILEWNIADLLVEDDSSKLEERSPVISIMGHVDHGKTSLLDYIRSSKVTDGEAWGITQSIWAYQVEQHGKKITFLDTPGHEAFTVMRARGAKSTDIAVLVVAADEWVKPQTIESINHAKEAGIPVIVAVNKMDKEGANPDFVKGQLSENGLTPEDWGGDTPVVPVSAHTGFGIDDLLEIILLVAEMKELKANPNRSAIATVIESHLDTQLGPVATVLVNTGTINKWDNIVCQESYGKVKILKNHIAKNIKLAWPSQPVLIVGLDRVVQW
jgi:translation initiation factor IF-2